MEVPSTEWREQGWTPASAIAYAPVPAEWRALTGLVRHTFTHFHLELTVMSANAVDGTADGVWCPVDRLGEYALPTVMKKVVRHALAKVGA